MRVGGNCKARAVFEANLPDHFRRPHSDSSMEAFIRAKYDHKKYMMKDWVKPRVNVEDLPCWEELQDIARGVKKTTVNVSSVTRVGKPKQQQPPTKLGASVNTETQKSPKEKVEKEQTTGSAIDDLLNLAPEVPSVSAAQPHGTSSEAAIDDLLWLGSGPQQPQEPPAFVASAGTTPVVENAPLVSNGETRVDDFGDFSLMGAGGNDGTKSKTDIMALYGSGGSSAYNAGVGGFQQNFDTGNQGYQAQQTPVYPQQPMLYGGMPQQMGMTFPAVQAQGQPGMVHGAQYWGGYQQPLTSPMGYSAFTGQGQPGGQMMGQPPVSGMTSPMGGYAGLQNVQNQFAGLNLQQANIPPGNTLSTNLWQ